MTYEITFAKNNKHIKMIRLHIKTGFEKEDIIKSSVIKEGQIVDEYLYSIRKK